MIGFALIKLLDIAELLILIRAIVSWLPIGRNRFTEMLYSVTEPLLAPIRSLLYKAMGQRAVMIDFSPIIAFLIIGLLKRLVVSALMF